MSQAQIAIKAAQNRHRWGRWASKQYALNRGVPLALYRLACQLEAAKAFA